MERHYPVEMPYLMDETYITYIWIYLPGIRWMKFRNLPVSPIMKMKDLFEYLIQKGEGNIQMRVQLKLNKTYFPSDEYGT